MMRPTRMMSMPRMARTVATGVRGGKVAERVKICETD